jgi:hypothetical protein
MLFGNPRHDPFETAAAVVPEWHFPRKSADCSHPPDDLSFAKPNRCSAWDDAQRAGTDEDSSTERLPLQVSRLVTVARHFQRARTGTLTNLPDDGTVRGPMEG